MKSISERTNFEVFETVPDLYLILTPELEVINASNAYLKATFTERSYIIGKYFSEAFTSNPEVSKAKAVANLKYSLEQTLKLKQPQHLEVQRYDVKKPEKDGGGFEIKYWKPSNIPILNPYGEVEYIIHKVLEVTGEIQNQKNHNELTIKTEHLLEEIIEAKKQVEYERGKLYELFLQAPSLISILKGPEFIYEFANLNFLKLIGDRTTNIIGKPVGTVFPELKEQGILDVLNKVYTTGNQYNANEALVKLDINNDGIPEELYFNMVYQPYLSQKGEIEGIFVHGVDVTPQVESRRATEEGEKKYRSLFNQMDQGFCIIELIFNQENKPLDYRFLEINPVFEQQTGLKGATGKTARELQPNLESHWFEIYGKVALTGESTRFTEGSEAMGRWFDVYAFRISDIESRKVAILFTDITERKQAEKSLTESEQRLSRIIEGSNDGIWEWDFKNDIAWWNERYTEILGIDIPNSGRSLKAVNQYVHPEDRHILNEALDEHLKLGKNYEAEFRLIRPSGEIRYIQIKGKGVKDNEGNISKLSGIISDITERKQAENNVIIKNKELTKINNDLDNFIYTASHDLKAPMSNIEGLLYSLREKIQGEKGVIDEETDFLLQLMEQSIDRFKGTILDLTEISKIQKTFEEDIKEIDISKIIEDVKVSISDKILDSGAEIEIDLSQINKIRFSRKNLKSIIYNLIINAIKYRDTTRHLKVFIQTEKTKQYTILKIKDNGLGIEEKNKEKLFTMFKRFHDHVEGTRIGLYIVKRIIDNSKGKIEVDSEAGSGTTFKVFFKN